MTEQKLSEAQAAVIERMRADAAKEWWHLAELYPDQCADILGLGILVWFGLIQKAGKHDERWRLTVEGLALPF